MHYACNGGHLAAARALFAARADVHARTKSQVTPLHAAALGGQAAVIR